MSTAQTPPAQTPNADLATRAEGATRPTIRLLPGHQKRARHGHPWIYSNEIAMDAAAKALAPGTVVKLQAADGAMLGCGFFNPHSLVAARMLAPDPALAIDADFLAGRLDRALALRTALYAEPYYRLVHSEADALPGLAIDRYGDVLAVQVNGAGIERALDALLEALERVVAPRAILLRNDAPVRALEGLESYVRVAKGSLDGPVELRENGCRFLADLAGGQKTGWFYDQRDNRAFMAALAKGRNLLDVYCHSGGFAIAAAKAGAASVLGIDSSAPALELAARAASLNGVESRCRFERGQAFETMEHLARAGQRFEVVICDPPAFVKSKRDIATGAKGYRKLARLAAELAAPGAFVFLASCSHNMEVAAFAAEVARGIGQAGRTGRILRSSGAAPDHPVHPQLPESAYLKAQVLELD
ncbi:MAG TPA: class I SAM-dependent rRNA methyltransferase [Alphaproteobacteria bacterium]|nr:class I SAM-dependent rRNA methyltransferase [Alphaproteobacteria bacterium]